MDGKKFLSEQETNSYPVEIVKLHKLFAEFYATDRIAHFVQRRRVEGDAHDIGNNQHQSSANARFGRQSDLFRFFIKNPSKVKGLDVTVLSEIEAFYPPILTLKAKSPE